MAAVFIWIDSHFRNFGTGIHSEAFGTTTRCHSTRFLSQELTCTPHELTGGVSSW